MRAARTACAPARNGSSRGPTVRNRELAAVAQGARGVTPISELRTRGPAALARTDAPFADTRGCSFAIY
mgnify:CR=1 FL=1